MWRDLSRYRNDGTLTNGPTLNTGIGGGISFDGVNDFVEMSLATSVVSNFTLTTWVKLASLNQNSVMFIHNGWDNRVNDGTGYGIGIGNGSGGSGGKLVGVASKVAWMDSGFTFSSTDKWYFVAMKRDTTTTRFYVDGILQSGTSTATPLTPQLKTSLAAQFNNISSYNGFFAGTLDDIRIYNRALSSDEIAQIFNATRRRFGI